MHRLRSIALDLAAGLGLLAGTYLVNRPLLATPARSHVFFPVVTLFAFAIGALRRLDRDAVPPWLRVVLLELPLAVALALLLSPRQRALFVLLPVTALAAAAGLLPRRPLARLGGLVALNAALALALPTFVGALVDARETIEPAPPFELHLVDGPVVRAAD